NDFAPGTDLDSIVTNAQNFQSLKTNGANVRLTWDLGAVKLYSITGYEHIGNYFSRGDIDGGIPTTPGSPGGPGVVPFQVQTGGFINGLEQYSQEFRVESKNTG